MAAKFLHSFNEDTADFQKQMGCMTGLFQLFDRQHMLSGSGRGVVGSSSESNPSGIPRSSTRSSESSQSKSASLEKHSTKNTSEKHRAPVETSMASFSSSSRSSLPSRGCTRAAHSESTSFDRVPENPYKEPEMSPLNSSPPVAQQATDIRNFVKDSMYRDFQGFRTKSSRNSHGPALDRRPSTPADVKKSLKVLAKLRNGAEHETEPRELYRSFSSHSRDVSLCSITRDAPRLSYDGTEINSASLDSFGSFKSPLKPRDLPRRSFDSRELSTESLIAEDIEACRGNVVRRPQQRSGPSVVAKLMGLDTLPGSDSSVDSVSGVSSSNKAFPKEPTLMPGSCQGPWKEPNSQCWRRNSDTSTGPATRFPIEPAPWKHTDRTKAPRGLRCPSRAEDNDKLEHIDFVPSAHKQIMGAMDIETSNEGQSSNISREVDSRKAEKVTSSARRNTASPQNYESSIVIMKPAKYAENHGVQSAPRLSGDESAYDRRQSSKSRASSERGNDVSADNLKAGRTIKQQTSVKTQHLAKDGNLGLGKNSGSLSPRMLQKKIEIEKKSLPPISPDSRKSRIQPNKPQSEMNSPARRLRPVPINSQQTGDHLSASNFELGTLKSCNVDDSDQSKAEISPTVSTVRSPTTKSSEADSIFSVFPDKESTLTSSEEDSGFAPPEFSSPVSVLDTGVRKLDLPPVKYLGMSLKVDEASSTNDEESNKLFHLKPVDSNSKEAVAVFDFNKQKLDNIENLVQKLRRLSSSCHDEARTDYIASLCKSSSPDHRYISEILLASGLLLRALTDFHFHPSGHPLNPELFLVLEQTKASTSPQGHSGVEKSHRKLIFDTVDEILSKKLSSICPDSVPWAPSPGLSSKSMTPQMLLQCLCSEIESLHAKIPGCSMSDEWKSIVTSDFVKQLPSATWMDYNAEISGAVRGVERLIFRDLVHEIAAGECHV